MDQEGSGWIKEITVMGGGVGGFPTRSRRIKTDQDGSRLIKGDHINLCNK